MKPLTTDFLTRSDKSVADARRVLAINLPEQAARLAYYSQFHAAQALIFERTGNIAKTHKGVRAQFHKLAKDDASIDRNLAGELTASYHYKEAADYQTGAAAVIDPADAVDAIRSAEHFLSVIKTVLTTSTGNLAP